MSGLVRPFGLLGARYRVSERGRLYYRLSWLSVAVGISLGTLVLVATRETATQGWLGIALMMLTVFAALRFTALVVENGEAVR